MIHVRSAADRFFVCAAIRLCQSMSVFNFVNDPYLKIGSLAINSAPK